MTEDEEDEERLIIDTGSSFCRRNDLSTGCLRQVSAKTGLTAPSINST